MLTIVHVELVPLSMLEGARIGIQPLFDPFHFGILLIGVIIGLVFGALPGLGGVVALSLLLPISYNMQHTVAIVLFAGALGGVAFGGSISAILINTPGTGPNAATCLDGFPLSRKGEANRAISASAISSAAGSIIGIMIFLLVLPFIRPIVFSFKSAEIFMLAVVGLSVIAYVQGRVIAGVLAGALGVGLSFTGADVITASIRYTFGLDYLYDGYTLVPVLVGIFAISEGINLAVKDEKIAQVPVEPVKGYATYFKEVFDHRWLLIRSSIIGFIIGVIPAAGGVTANFIAYAQAIQTSKEPETFGTGRIEGVISAEASNDAKDGGALLPSLALGIPGSAAWAVIIGGFTLQGLFPGPDLVRTNISLIYLMAFALIIANVLTSSIGLLTVNYLHQITRLSPPILVSSVFVLSVVGTFAVRFSMPDVYVAVIFGILGYVMIIYDWPRISLVLGLILGPIAERNFHTALQTSSYDTAWHVFFLRPIALLLFVIAVLSLLAPAIRTGVRRL